MPAAYHLPVSELLPTVGSLLAGAAALIDPVDAQLLLAHALGRDRGWLYAHGRDPVDADARARFAALLARRQAGEPVAYLRGRQGFWTLELAVTPDTLIPRPETELLVELALERVADGLPVRTLDMGTGSGAIALALARERPGAEVTATDRSAAALEVARRNAHDHDIGNVRFALGDWYQPVRGMRFGLIASNPPYIADGDGHLERGDLRFEPAGALASGGDGLDALRVIAAGAREHLQPGGWLLVEHGLEQGPAVRALFAEAGLEAVETARDLEDRERVTLGRLPGAG